jgi:hypothetical protein
MPQEQSHVTDIHNRIAVPPELTYEHSMKNARLAVPVEESYLLALGRTTFVFSRLEWAAAWCCEHMETNYLHTTSKKTAGNIADDFIRLISNLPDQTKKAARSGPATEFHRLVKLRNSIVHSNVGTTPAGEQQLFRQGRPWTPEMLEDAADEFAACEATLNQLR